MHYIEIRDGFATVTNAHVLIRADVSDVFAKDDLERLNGRYIHYKQWEFLCKKDVLIGCVELDDSGVYIKALTPLGVLRLKTEFIKDFPKYDDIVNGAIENDGTLPHVSMDAELVHTLSKALGEKKLTFAFGAEKKAILVRTEGSKWMAMIIPLLMNVMEESIDRFKLPVAKAQSQSQQDNINAGKSTVV
jgi:hypothetical protein